MMIERCYARHMGASDVDPLTAAQARMVPDEEAKTQTFEWETANPAEFPFYTQVSLTVASSNQITAWLREMHLLRQAAAACPLLL